MRSAASNVSGNGPADSSGGKKIRISARAIREDIKNRLDDRALMEKYGLSLKNLLRVKRTLVANGLLSEEEIQNQGAPARPGQKTLQAGAFMRDFRQRPDDFYLMKRYELTPRQLKKVYDAMQRRGLLSDFELNSRDRIAPELQEVSDHPIAASTVVSMVENQVEEVTQRIREEKYGGLPSGMFKDFSGRKIGSGAADSHPHALRNTSTVVDILPPGTCPKCGSEKEHREAASCAVCGIVFWKYRRGSHA
jgi:hypothetical protein